MTKTEELAQQMFSQQDLEEIRRAIADAEKKTSGEIKVDFEYDVQRDPLHHAHRIFQALGLSKTAEWNATLIVLFLSDRKFAIVGDREIHRRVPPDFWDSLSAQMETEFRRGDFKNGLLLGIGKLGEKLANYFPHEKGDRDEISDRIAMSGDEEDMKGI